jgi:hypothetical protein
MVVESGPSACDQDDSSAYVLYCPTALLCGSEVAEAVRMLSNDERARCDRHLTEETRRDSYVIT